MAIAGSQVPLSGGIGASRGIPDSPLVVLAAMLKALATNAGAPRLYERFESARLQALQDSGIGVVVEAREELRGF